MFQFVLYNKLLAAPLAQWIERETSIIIRMSSCEFESRMGFLFCFYLFFFVKTKQKKKKRKRRKKEKENKQHSK